MAVNLETHEGSKVGAVLVVNKCISYSTIYLIIFNETVCDQIQLLVTSTDS